MIQLEDKVKKSENQFCELRFPVPWGHVAAKEWGSKKGKRILVVHGTLDNAGSFDRLIALLPQDNHYVSIDLPGHGLSSHFPSGIPLDFFNFVFAIHLVVDLLQWDILTYIGHSLGAHLGIQYSILYPEKVEKLIAIDAIIPLPVPDDLLYDRIRIIYDSTIKYHKNNESPLYSQDEVSHALKFRRISTLNTEAANALFTRAVTKVGNNFKYNRDPRLKNFVRPLMSIQQYFKSLKRLSTPVLIIMSNNTLTQYQTPEIVEVLEFLRTKETCSIITVPGNHDVHNNNPERVAPHISAYLIAHDVKSKL